MQNKSGEFSEARLDAARKLLSLFHSPSCRAVRELVKDIEPSVLLPKVEVALRNIKLADVLRFDPYLVSGYEPSENQISNALQALLDPSGVHGLGAIGLFALLDAVETEDNLVAGKVLAITNALKQPVATNLVREFSIESGRVDIRVDIRTSTGEKFLVFVENKKVWDAQEVGPIPQTLRYEKRLREEEEAGVLGLGIYLTPDQKPAESKLFAPLSCGRFAACLRKRLSAKEIKMSDDASAPILLYAFALTYAWMN